MNKKIITLVIIAISQIVLSNDLSVGITGSLASPITKEVIQKEKYSNQFIYGVSLRKRVFHNKPIVSGLLLNYSNKTLDEYIPSITGIANEGAGSVIGTKEDIRLKTVEIPLLFAYSLSNRSYINSGFLVGLANITHSSSFRFYSRETGEILNEIKNTDSKNELVITPGIEYQTLVWSKYNILVSVSYRILKTKFVYKSEVDSLAEPIWENNMLISANSPDTIVKFDLSGVYFSLTMSCNFNTNL